MPVGLSLKTRNALMSDHHRILKKSGFSRIGIWEPDEGEGHIRCSANVEPKPAVYAYLVDGKIKYVGSAQRGLRARFRSYARTKQLRTAYRIRQEILKAHKSNQEVEIFILMPPPEYFWKGLPVDLIAGIEEGIIRTYRPDWNRRGKGLRRQEV